MTSSSSPATPPPPPPQPISTSFVLLETSAGALIADLFGCDCPALTGNFVNVCRAKFWAGAVATEVVPDVAVFFSHAADPVYDAAVLQHAGAPPSFSSSSAPSEAPLLANDFSLLTAMGSSTPSPRSPGRAAPVGHRESRTATAAREEFVLCRRRVSQAVPASGGGGRRCVTFANCAPGAGAGSLGKKGLLIVEAALPDTTVTASSMAFRFGLTLSDRTMDFLEKQYVAIGVVREGFRVLETIRRAPHTTAAATTLHGTHLLSSTSLNEPLARAAGAAAERLERNSVYVSGTARWPRPLRMLRLKHVTVLPTPGTEPFLPKPRTQGQSQSQSSLAAPSLSALMPASPLQARREKLAAMLTEAGCFTHWAAPSAVVAASRHLVRAVRATQAAYRRLSAEHADTAQPPPPPENRGEAGAADGSENGKKPTGGTPSQAFFQPLVQLPASATRSTSSATGTQASKENDMNVDDVVSIEYNPHCTADYLSSDEEADTGEGDGNTASTRLRRKELEARREAAKQLHQSKANETLSLMLNILNGVADVSGDLQPPDNVLFVCKLNPATTGEGLAMCFRQFGSIRSAEVVMDKKTGKSLCYGFVEFDSVDACYRAFQKMDRALIDDCRIHVDFSQSVSKLWFARKRDMRKRGRE